MTHTRLATPNDVTESLAFALRWNGQTRVHTGDEFMAGMNAERIIEHLRIAGFVVMKKPPTRHHSAISAPPSV